MAWWKPFEGQIRRAIEVHSWGEPFVIDNEDGLGYSKITKGAGMWTSGSRHFDKDNIELVGETPENEIVKAFLKDRYDEIGSISDAYWAKEKPDEHKRLQVLKKLATAKFSIH